MNCVELENFRPQALPHDHKNRILVVGRIRPEKNPINLIRAVHLLNSKGIHNFEVNWYGNAFLKNNTPTDASKTFLESSALAKQLGVEHVINFHEPIDDVRILFRSHDAVCLPSFFEGFSNVLGEAAASGRPLLASNVCDNPVLVRSSNGILFDPASPQSIAEALASFFKCGIETRHAMGIASRQIAEEELSPKRFMSQYMDLLAQHAQPR